MPIRRSQKKRNAEPRPKQNQRRLVIDPMVNPGSSAHRHQARSKAHPTRTHHRMVTLAQSSPGDRSACAPQSKMATVMLGRRDMKWTLQLARLACAGLLLSAANAWAGPKIVSGPGADPACFKPWSDQTKFFQWDKKPGPYKIALVNGFVGNTWRIQMVKTAKAFAEQPGIKENIKEFKVVSTGTDVAAQLGAMEDFINQGFDAIVTIAVAPDGFDRIIRLADKNNVVVVPFDNILDTDKVMMVNEDQKEMGRMSAKWLIDETGKKTGDILEVRGLPGNSVDRDRHLGFREVMEGAGNKFNITEVVGNWDTGTSQKVTADALAVHGHFDGVFTQGGSDGTVQAMIAAKHA